MSQIEWLPNFSSHPLRYPGHEEPFAYQFEVIYGVFDPSTARLPIQYLTLRAVVDIVSRRPLHTRISFFDIIENNYSNWAIALYIEHHPIFTQGG